jgi:hypothetical protein
MAKKAIVVLFAGLVGTTASSSLQRRLRAQRSGRVTLDNLDRVRRTAQNLLDGGALPEHDAMAVRNVISALDAAEINHAYGQARKVKRCLAFASRNWPPLAKRYLGGARG